MRPLRLGFPMLMAVASLLSPGPVRAQDKEKPKPAVKINQVRVGFRSYVANDGAGQFKVGLWTPIFVDITPGPKGVAPMDPAVPSHLKFESTDSEGVSTYYRSPVPILDAKDGTQTFIGYTKPGNRDTAGHIGVTFHWDDKTYKAPPQLGAPLFNLGSHLYLSLGSRIPDLQDSLVALARQAQPNVPQVDFDNRDTFPRFAAFETDPARLPDLWFGYQGVDFMILCTDSKTFLEELQSEKHRPRLKALAQWVRRGGRLVIPVNHLNQDILHKVLTAPVWQPPVPVVPPADAGNVIQAALKRLDSIESWADAKGKPFPPPGGNPVPVAKLDPGHVSPGVWDVHAQTDGRPLITQMPYGDGSIAYVAFSLDQPPFTRWTGRVDFLKTLIDRFAPRVSNVVQPWGAFGDDTRDSDITTGLQRTLDNFDVNVIPFGYVALFIILYILVVGPLDYFVLKHVFNKLEWTWFTFPTVVIAVSVAAYCTAYALKGNDLKINKVDIVDFDLRTDLGGKDQTAGAYAYGHTYFTILSPRIQNYTVGVQPNAAFWGGKAADVTSADQVSWLGRPDPDGPGAMGRGGAQGFFRRPYDFAADGKGIEGVPIPVWTTKSFNASWEAALPKIPFDAKLFYHTRFGNKTIQLSGSIKNNLPVDLEDVWLFFGNHCYALKEGLKGNGAAELKLALELGSQKDIKNWVSGEEARLAPRNQDFRSVQGAYDPTLYIRQAMFFGNFDQGNTGRNHSMRFLDYSWRLQGEINQGETRETRLREAILYAHVPFQRGRADAIANGPMPVPTHVWLGDLPEPGKTPPAPVGTLAQDTYIRVLLPVRVAPND